MADGREPRWSRGALVGTSLALGAALLLGRIPLLTTRRFDPDELEHAHVAYCLNLGLVPFKDFFEHHTPVFHYLLAALFSLFDMASPDDAMRALFTARFVTWGISVVVVLQTFWLARLLRDNTTGWVVLPVISGSIVVALRALEIRPDGLSTVLWLTSIGWLYRAMSAEIVSATRTRAWFGLSGLAIGLAVLTSQKLLLAGPAIAALLLWYLTSERFGGSVRTRLTNIAVHAAAVLSLWGLAVAWFAKDGAALDFLRSTLFDNLRWKSETTAGTILRFVVRYEPWLFALTAGGVWLAVRELVRSSGRTLSHVFLLVTAVGLFAGLFMVPVPYAQYCLTFLPLFAILSADFLVRLAGSTGPTGPTGPDWPTVVGSVCAVVLAILGVWIARPFVIARPVYPAIMLGTVLVLVVARRWRLPGVGLAAALVGLSVLPVQWGRWMQALGDEGQFAAMRLVLAEAGPDDVVLDGWSGYGALRRHASYYWMLHPGVRAMLTPRDIAAFVETLEIGRVRPKVIVFDGNLRALSPELEAMVRRNYRDLGQDVFVRSQP